ncbi:MAG: Crp/Fnr family transcriptional regulator [Actinomycetota bacterium]|nr:Crp/Fnr family transcriptional regulator [Actinomycetota bacterium]
MRVGEGARQGRGGVRRFPLAERARLLSAVDVFERLPEGQLWEIASASEAREYAEGEPVFGPGTGCNRVFVLERGRVRLYRSYPGGREITFAVLARETVFGRLAPRAGSQGMHACALAPSLVSSLGQAQLEDLARRRPEVGLGLARLADYRLSLSEDWAAGLTGKEVPARLAGLLLRLVEHEGVVTREGHKIPTRYTHALLGTMVGANRDTVTRAFAVLKEAGAVELRDRLILVPDLGALERAAG